jgi:hypothetical protein
MGCRVHVMTDSARIRSSPQASRLPLYPLAFLQAIAQRRIMCTGRGSATRMLVAVDVLPPTVLVQMWRSMGVPVADVAGGSHPGGVTYR